jgi:hypothetical protein
MSGKRITKSKFREFSKRVIVAMALLWFLGAIFGAVCVWRTQADLPSLLEYIGNPMSVGVLGYLIKSAFENKTKIERGLSNEYSDEAIG